MKFCIVVPVFRHAIVLSSMIKELLNLELTLFIIDDGNNEFDRKLLEDLTKNPQIILIKHQTNLGKGAAIVSGLAAAKKDNFTHVLQIDADAQHCTDDIPKFIEMAKLNPEHLILGKPIFDQTAPLARVLGRKLTTSLIWLETLSLQVADGLFGFRIYPLEKTISVVTQTKIDQRMGFDTEIIVRLLRAGVKVINIPTAVTYPKTGISNFRYFKDNLNLVFLHLRLLFTSHIKKESNWHDKKEHGTTLALRLLLVLYRFGGKALLNLLIYPVVFYFFIKDKEARKNSRDYLDRAIGKQASVFRHFMNFGQKIISSLQGWLGEIHPREIDWHNRNLVFDLIDKKKGALVLSAHFGCLEITRATQGHKKGLKITPLMYLKNSQVFRGFLREINPKAEQEIIYVDSIHPGVAIDIQNRINKGEFIAILADRIAPNSPERCVEINLLGQKALLPEGPFALAMSLECPVFSFFSYFNQDLGKYCAYWQKLEFTRPKNRTNRRLEIANCAQLFANELEFHCKVAPYQWFNFYNFWQSRYQEAKQS